MTAILESLNINRCPDCGGEKFLAGPEGGLSQNIKCANCGSEFNYCPPCTVMPSGYAERINSSWWWAFGEENLRAALADWLKARLAEQPGRKTDFELQAQAIRDFLVSDQARAHKMRGDQ